MAENPDLNYEIRQIQGVKKLITTNPILIVNSWI